ncbi:MAG: hypothetical protein J5925_02800 [Clostridia bacterium]|nr:hypothetical protein [Clostridia bacterium]MBR5745752.1 hypothetical protein [Clostridia bacterium]
MDYKKYAKELLCRKKNLVSALSAINAELESLELEKCACKSSVKNREGEGGEYTGRIINIVSNIEDCRLRRSVVERELTMIEKGMSGLSDYQKDLLERFFIEKDTRVADAIMERYYKERSSVYRDRNRALEEFTRSVYGVLQL